MNTMIVPLDGSPLAERVLPYVQYLAPHYDADVQLVRVVSDSVMVDAAIGRYYQAEMAALEQQDRWQQAYNSACAHANGYLFSMAARLHGLGIRATSDVCDGTPVDVIVDAARRPDAWITMATHGRSGVRRWALGSVADAVVQLSHAPVLLVRAGDASIHEWAVKRVLVPLDGSMHACQALPLAYDVAARTGAEVQLLEVLNPLPEAEVVWDTLPRGFDARRRADAEAELNALAGEGRAQGLHVTATVTAGYPAEEIIHAAARRNVDLIVMATHGRSGIRRLVLGSVADKVLHALPTPLLLVRPSDA